MPMTSARMRLRPIFVAACLWLTGVAALAQQEFAPASGQVGVNAHLPSDRDCALMEKAGIRWARVDLTWDVVEPRQGQYRWDLIDHVVENASGHGVKLLGVLGYCPDWASCDGTRYSPPANPAEWAGFVDTITSRYKDCIEYWTLWNEPNNDRFFHGTMDDYLFKVLLPGVSAARIGNPNCKIVGPDLAHLSAAHWDTWLDYLLMRAGGYFDVIGHHCYKGDPQEVLGALEGPAKPWDPPSVRSILEKRGAAAKPFWLTEVGFGSKKAGQEKQAAYLAALLRAQALRPWLDKVFIFELRDSPGLPDYGLLRQDGTPKPAFRAVRALLKPE
jgi:hypothetical protein